MYEESQSHRLAQWHFILAFHMIPIAVQILRPVSIEYVPSSVKFVKV